MEKRSFSNTLNKIHRKPKDQKDQEVKCIKVVLN